MICADRGGGRFELSDGERHLLWTLGKTAALVATARIATRQQEQRAATRRAARPRPRDPRARPPATVRRVARAQRRARARRRRARALPQRAAVGDRRSARGARAAARAEPAETVTTLADELERRRAAGGVPIHVSWPDGLELPAELEAPAQSFLAEALRNVAKHADATRIDVELSGDGDTVCLQVRNDGVRDAGRRGRHGPTARRLRGAAARRHGRVRRVRRRWLARAAGAPAMRVLVVDDHDVVHWGFRVLLGAAAVGGALPCRPHWRRGARADAALAAACRAGRPVPRRRVGGRRVRRRSAPSRPRRGCC